MLVALSCTTTKKVSTGDYILRKYEISNHDFLPFLIVSCYDYDPEGRRSPIPARIELNKIIFGARIEGDSIYDMVFRPRPNLTVDLEVNWLGKIPVQIMNLKINKNDSIIIEINLKDSNEPIICY